MADKHDACAARSNDKTIAGASKIEEQQAEFKADAEEHADQATARTDQAASIASAAAAPKARSEQCAAARTEHAEA